MSRGKKIPRVQQVTLDDLDAEPSFISVQSLSVDGRRLREQQVRIAPPSPSKSQLQERHYGDEDFALEGAGDCVLPHDWGIGMDNSNGSLDMEESEGVSELKKGVRRSAASDSPMQEWLPLCSAFLDEWMSLEGRGGANFLCRKCRKEDTSLFRCRECYIGCVFCAECMKQDHWSRPLHRVERWNGKFFERCTLASIGLHIQLAHPPGEDCSLWDKGWSGFVVVDVDGIQEVSIRFCSCQKGAGKDWQQLLRYGLYPATVNEPRTAFTFRVLSWFHTLTLQGKVTLYDFYHSLESRTDATGLSGIKDRYQAFIRVMRQWRYLKLLKRSGIGNQSGRCLAKLEPGALAVRCWACPRPGINLPPGWENWRDESSYLYQKFIAVDACFHLKRRAISSESKDPGLYTGAAYFVSQQAYQEWMRAVPQQKNRNTCSGLQAVEQANTRFSKGYATTGALLCICARHEIVEPCGMVDLDKGEKFGLADYAVASSQRLYDGRLRRVLSYDIVCQYCIKFFMRMRNLPPEIQMRIREELWRFAIPKLHILGHQRPCQEKFSLHLLRGSGQTDGEGIERHWSGEGIIGTSTREMGPGHRRDTVDDHFGAKNFRKNIGLGVLLRKKERDARINVEIQTAEYEQFTRSQPTAVIKQWRKLVIDWENGQSELNPYSLPDIGDTEADVRLRYAEKEAAQIRAGEIMLHEVSPSALLDMGLDLEQEQRELEAFIEENKATTTLQKTDLVERRSKVERSLYNFRKIQKVYLPCIRSLLSPETIETDISPVERINLFLPSGVSIEMRSDPAWKAWIEMELEFRRGQLRKALWDIRSRLFVRTRLLNQRSTDVRHQKETRHSQDVLGRNQRELEKNVAKYRAAWKAVNVLQGEPFPEFRELKQEDIRAMEDRDLRPVRNERKRKRNAPENPLLQAGESRRTVSWIWNGVDTSADSKSVQDAIRVEWSKAWARKRRWEEEQNLVKEEQRRTLASLEHEEKVWQGRVGKGGSDILAGMAAYAYRQAAIRANLREQFQALWSRKLAPAKPRRRAVIPEDPTVASNHEGSGNEGSDDEGSNDGDSGSEDF